MSKKNILTGLDIGSHSIKMISVFKKPGSNDLELIKTTEPISSEVRKGVVIDVSGVAKKIEKMVSTIEEKVDQKLESVYLAINGSHLSCFFSPGVVSVSRADQKISQEDVERVLQNCKILPLKSNQNKIINIFSRGFNVDQEGKVKDPVGMQGLRLEAEIIAVCGFSPYLDNSVNSVINGNLDVEQCFPAPVASANAVLTEQDKEAGVLVIDIGACTTSLAVFEEGNLVHTKVFPVGSRNITHDIAVYFKIDIETAEKIKTEFGDLLSLKDQRIKVQTQEESVSFSKKELKKVIEARLLEILRLVKQELKLIDKNSLPAGVVLTGGGSQMSGLKELAKKEFKLATRIGLVSQINDPSFSTAWGLILEAQKEQEDEADNFFLKIIGKFKKLIKIFTP
ncbi:MAG: cell division protein FtsA [Candidatus Pacebacteria bacterium]|nr:cell division protein FtsA [Candidatus Paceibacterota bacterium]